MGMSTKKFTKKRPLERQNATVSSRPFKQPKQSFQKSIGAVASRGPESKDITSTYISAPAGVNWDIQLVNGTVLGNAASGMRVGRKIGITKLVMRYSCAVDGRVAIVYDRDCNGVAPTALQIWLNNSINGLNRLENNDRFLMLADVYLNDEQMTTLTGTINATGMLVRKFREPLLTTYLDVVPPGTGGIADIASGAIFLCFVTAQPAGGTMNSAVRLRFTDS